MSLIPEINRGDIEILIAEDSPTQALHLEFLLTQHGFKVTMAENGAKALELAQKNQPTLIISDVMMPEMTGLELARAVRATPEISGTPIILVTTLASPQDVVLGLDAGADNFIRKPYDERYLIQRVEYILANRALRQREKLQMGIEIALAGQRHFITAEKQQILDLLISTYEEAVHLNKDLEATNQKLNAMYRVAEGLNQCVVEEELMETVLERVMSIPGISGGWFSLIEHGECVVAWMRGLPAQLQEPEILQKTCKCWMELERTGRASIAENCALGKEDAGTGHGPFSHATTPIRGKDNLLGVLSFLGEGAVSFGDEELSIMEAIGHQVGLALERARLYAHLEQQVEKRTQALKTEVAERKRAESEVRLYAERLKKLSDLSEALAESITEQGPIAGLGARYAVELVGDGCVISLLEKDSTYLVPKAWFHSNPAQLQFMEEFLSTFEVPLRESLALQAIESGAPLVFQNVNWLELLQQTSERSRPYFERLQPANLIIIPLRAQGEPLGVISVCRERGRGRYTQEEISFLSEIGSRVAQAMHNARMYGQLVQSEAALRETSEMLSHLVATSPTVLYSLRFDRAEYVPVWVSENITPITGWPKERFLEPGWILQHVHPEDQEKLDLKQASQSQDENHSVEFRFENSDGEWLWIQDDRRLLLDAQGTPLEIVGSWTDVTSRKQSEAELRQVEEQLFQAQKLESIGSLAGGIAHDMNNILSAINGFTELVLMELPEDSHLKEELECVLEAGQRGANLVRQILAFSRRQVLQPRVLNLNEVVRSFEKMLGRLLEENVQIRLILADRLCNVSADEVQMEQVLLNLVVNARDAMPGGGTVTIETANVLLDETYAGTHAAIQPGEYVMLGVSDTGHGMDAETRRKIFEPFFTTKGAERGTGLGLSTVYGIVKQHQGTIWVYSELDRGTTFKIYLPVRTDGAAAAESELEPQVLQPGHETVLVVEDEMTVRQLVLATLNAHGYQTIEAESAQAALEICADADRHIDLVISDVIMPGMNGPEFLKRAKELRPGLKGVYISGYTRDAIDLNAPIEDGVMYLQKPFTIRALLEKVQEALKKEA